ncbi:MAG: hypothetical protein E6I97_07595 [Chloroflexi bacterium]|nr:MAG: hypothetical protein E6I97_07595 [Chloroflexota bacterium]
MILEDLKHELQKLDLAAFYHRSDEEWLNEEQSSLADQYDNLLDELNAQLVKAGWYVFYSEEKARHCLTLTESDTDQQ